MRATNQGRVRILENHMPGYGGPETWAFRVTYKRFTLDKASTTSERSVELIASRLRRKWRNKTTAELDALVSGRKPEWDACSVCGTDDTDGGASNSTTTWCGACYRALNVSEEKARQDACSCRKRVCKCYGQGPLRCACRAKEGSSQCAGCGEWLRALVSLYWHAYPVERVRLGKLTRIPFRDRHGERFCTGDRVRLVGTDGRHVIVRVAKIIEDDGLWAEVEATGEQAPEMLPLNHYVLGQVRAEEDFQRLRAG